MRNLVLLNANHGNLGFLKESPNVFDRNFVFRLFTDELLISVQLEYFIIKPTEHDNDLDDEWEMEDT